MADYTHHIFLSHSKRDVELMRVVRLALEAEGFRVWVDESEIEPGTPSWRRLIEDSLDRSATVVVIFSPDARKSEWVRKEIEYAETHEIKIFPLLGKGDPKTALPFGYTGAQYIDIRANAEGGLARLAVTIAKHLDMETTAQRTARAAAEAAERARQQAEQARLEAEARERQRKEAEERERKAREAAEAAERQRLQGEQAQRAAEERERLRAAAEEEKRQKRLAAEEARSLIEASSTQSQRSFLNSRKRILTIIVSFVLIVLTTGSIIWQSLPGGAIARIRQSMNTAAIKASLVNPITANDQWTPQFATFDDGIEMALVPAGCFMMGINGEGGEQCFEPFYIDRTEVTQADFERLGGVKANPNRFDGADRPVERITWFEARDFCALRGARLPTEAEWEYAARGPDGRVYPWGNDFVADNVVYSENSNSQTANVGSRPGGASWVGAYDLSGNVWEWVSSVYADYPYDAADGREDINRTDEARVLRGGSWGDGDSHVRAANRYWVTPDYGNVNGGFRCACS